MSDKTISVEQAVRKSHCARSGHEHECVGTCTITRDGIKLDCPICGEGDGPREYIPDALMQRARRVVGVLGLRWDALSVAAQGALVRELANDQCPGCKQLHVHLKEYARCSCGQYKWSSYRGWERDGAAP